MKSFLNKEVLIYPGDSYKKTGIVREVTSKGVVFEITAYNGTDDKYEKGLLHFIAYSANLSFRLLKPNEKVFKD